MGGSQSQDVTVDLTSGDNACEAETVNGAVASSGGQGMITANLTLPGDFAFQTFTTDINTNGLNTSQQSMEPRDPSLQNRRRQATVLVNPVTIEIS